MKTLKKIITAGLIAITITTSFAQRGGRNIYNWALGVRYEFQGGINEQNSLPTVLLGPTFKYLLDPQKDIEIMYLSDFSNGTDIYAMFHIFNPFPEIPQNFRYYAGLGGHGGRWRFDKKSNAKFDAGIDGQIGVELIGRKIPLAVSFDWHPSFNVMSIDPKDPKLLLLKLGITLKYAYKH